MNNENVGMGEQDLAEMQQKPYEALFAFSEEFAQRLKEERLKLPYHLNLMDELHPNENAHSRILLRLLQFANENGAFEIYRSLLDYIKKRQPSFGDITIEKPRMTQEEARIDLWVRDETYAIIFENKIYNAQDQEAQLARYIEKTAGLPGKKYAVDKDIFVVYLSSDGRQKPDNQSWIKVEGEKKIDYKSIISDRYINLSFRNDIYPWLKEQVLPNVQSKDVYLKTALVQYVDYLEGRYYLRETEKQLKMKMDAFIENKLELQGKGDTMRMQKLDELFKNQDDVLKYVWEMRESERKRIFDEWRRKTQEKYSALNPNAVGYEQMESVTHIIIDSIEGKKVAVYIGWQEGRLFCQVEVDYHLPEQKRDIRGLKGLMKLYDERILPEGGEGVYSFCIWKWMGQDYDATYELFSEVVERCLKMRDSQPQAE